ncbi:MAG TPA: hypothetical protein VMV75_08160 [Sulfuricella sp.]|nr:hypothetical protein [Sulfuricella sp.]
MKSRLLVSTFMLTVGSCGAMADSLNPQPLAVKEQIAVLKKQSQEMREQIDALKQQNWQLSPSRRVGGFATPQVVLITNGKDDRASVQSLKQAIETMNGRS